MRVLLWNPGENGAPDSAEWNEHLKSGELFRRDVWKRWSFGQSKSVEPGETLWMMVVGQKHERGIIGVAEAKNVMIEPSFRDDGKLIPYVELRWLQAVPFEYPLTKPELSALGAGSWPHIQSSGYRLQSNWELPLKKAWKEHFKLAKRSEGIIDNILGLEQGSNEVRIAIRDEKDATVRRAIVNSRLGQGQFRKDLLQLHSQTCPVTGVRFGEGLKASHIKPWAECNNRERLDPYNGLPLAPHIDWLFDSGHISFDDDGSMLISKTMPADLIKKWSIDTKVKIRVHKNTRKYLKWHREHKFKADKK